MLKEKVCVFGCVCVSDWVWYLMAETPNVGCFQWVCKLFVLNSCPFRLCHSNALGRTLFFFRLVWPKNLCKLVHSFPTFYLFFLHSYALFFSPPIHIYTFYVAKAFPCFSHFIFNWNMCKFAFEVSHHHLLLLFSPPFLFLLLLLLWVTLILFALTDNNNIETRSGCSRADERWKKSVSRIVLTGNDSFETDRRLQKKKFSLCHTNGWFALGKCADFDIFSTNQKRHLANSQMHEIFLIAILVFGAPFFNSSHFTVVIRSLSLFSEFIFHIFDCFCFAIFFCCSLGCSHLREKFRWKKGEPAFY